MMNKLESITFGGSGLDRVAELRNDTDALAAAHKDKANFAIVLWRGKPLISGDEDLKLVKLPLSHAVFEQANSEPILLGQDDNGLCFALDISNWDPADQESPDGGFLDFTEQTHPALPATHRFCELRMIMTRLSARDAELAGTAKALFSWHRSHQYCAACGTKSIMSMAGWQRGCPDCGTQHFPRTDPVVIMLITHGNRVLLGRSPGWPEGMYSLLAGFVEPGETPEAAVRREVFEEAQIRVGAVRYLGSQPWAFPTSLMIGCAGEALNDEIVIDPKEIEDALWVSREEMMQIFAGQHPSIKAARKGAIAYHLLRNWLADCTD
jgi:NAD+ diphosphatase